MTFSRGFLYCVVALALPGCGVGTMTVLGGWESSGGSGIACFSNVDDVQQADKELAEAGTLSLATKKKVTTVTALEIFETQDLATFDARRPFGGTHPRRSARIHRRVRSHFSRAPSADRPAHQPIQLGGLGIGSARERREARGSRPVALSTGAVSRPTRAIHRREDAAGARHLRQVPVRTQNGRAESRGANAPRGALSHRKRDQPHRFRSDSTDCCVADEPRDSPDSRPLPHALACRPQFPVSPGYGLLATTTSFSAKTRSMCRRRSPRDMASTRAS